MKEAIMSTAEAYLKAWDAKDLASIAKYLSPDVRFVGPMNDLTGRDSFLESSKRVLPLLKAVKVHSKFDSGDQAFFAYDFICAEPIGVCRTAELMTFKDGLINRIELFYDARPFEKLMKKP